MRTQVEKFLDVVGDFAIAHRHVALAIGVDIDGDGFCHTDGVAQLHKHLVSNASCHHILSDVACGIGC